MKKSFAIIAATLCSLMALAQAPAFPGAEGVARWTTTGGRGGKVYHVTSLEDTNTEGTLRYACSRSGARIVVFDVSGIIELKSQLKISNPNITILGQTAPGDGICLKNYTFNISTSNVIIRFIRSRMGDAIKGKGDDAMNSYTHNNNFNNIIIDHCTLSWSTDECGSFYGINNFTLQWCVLSESLANSIHEKGSHGYGGIWGGKNAAYHHNLLASHTSRNPRFDHDYVSTLKGPVDFVNNVVYNWGGNSTYGGESCNTTGEYKMYNMINNYYKPGSTSSNKTRIVNPTTKCTNCTGESTGKVNLVPGHFYISGNHMEGSATVTNDNWQGVHPDENTAAMKASIKSDTRFIPEGYEEQTLITTHTAEKAFEKVLNYVGACYKRDVIDQRIVNETNTGTYTYLGSNGSTGGFIDTPNDVGGWPTYVSTDKLTDTDNDGMPDVWETANGLNPNDATDAATKTLDAKGYYTNIEVYANSLVEDLVKAQNADATEAIEEYYPNVTKAEGIQYYDANVTAEGGYETNTAEGEAGNIMWEMKSDLNAQLSDEASKATEASAATYGTNLVLTGRGTYNNVRFARFQAQTIQTAAADDNAVVFSITPKTGFKFKATIIQFTACKVGTGNGNFDAKWIDAGVTIALYNNESPNRNNSDGGYFSAYNKDVSALSTSSEEACQLKLNIYNVGATNSDGTINKKEMGLANVVVKGLMIDDTAGISTPVSFGTPVVTEYFTIDGRRLQQPQHGVNIQVARMANGKKVTTKVIK